ncbi:MAG: membrane integrity-associated transporter subunit PqiC [Leptospiraceae bacterium]|nr:membrane integrity-associated transporter subunit PqiC [Leptospiraceae bacterium]
MLNLVQSLARFPGLAFSPGSLRIWLRPSIISILCMGLAGYSCLGLERSAPAKRIFALQIAPSPHDRPAAKPIAANLLVRNFYINPVCASSNLLYRLSANEYSSDYYNELIVPPALALNNEITRWLASAGLFQQVIIPGSQSEPDFILEASITEFYGDYRADQSRAVVSIRFVLLEADTLKTRFSKEYRQTADLPERSPDALLQAWGAALQQMMIALSGDLAQSGLASSPSS